MADTKFRVGDRVRLKSSCFPLEKGFEDVVKRHRDTLYIGQDKPDGTGDRYCTALNCQHNWELVNGSSVKSPKVLPPRFILQYELDTDPFELFATEKEVRARIKELAQRRDLKRDSIKVYEIKNVRTVELGTSIKIIK